jgi:signal transduction histidine kinase
VLIASRVPANGIGWILCSMSLLYGVRRLAMAYTDYALVVQTSLPEVEYAAWVGTWLRFSGLIASGALLVLLFPEGRLPSQRWRVVVWLTIGGAVMLALGDAFRFGPLTTYYHVYNPLGVVGTVGGVLTASQVFEALSVTGGVLLSVGCVASLLALALRLREARAEERRQLRWFSYAAVPALIGSVLLLSDWTAERFALLFFGKAFWPLLRVVESVGVLVRNPQVADRLADLRLDMVLDSLTASAFLAVSIGTGYAIFEHHLYDWGLRATRTVRGTTPATSTPGWLRILLAGAAVGFSPVVFNLAVYAYVVFYPTLVREESSPEQPAEAVAFASGWAAGVSFLVATILAAWWVAKRARGMVTLHGILIGLVAAIVNQATMLYPYNLMASYFYQPATLGDLSAYMGLGVVGGWLGGSAGRATLAGEVYRATRRIGEANEPRDVAVAIGEELGGADAHDVTLLRVLSRADGTDGAVEKYVTLGSWTPRGDEPWLHDAKLGEGKAPSLHRLGGGASVVLRSEDLPAAGRAEWERLGIRSALLVPLLAPGDVLVGLLAATFRKRRRFSREVVRAYLTVGAQAALALENMRLVEEARHAGRQAGLLEERQRLAHEIHDTLAQGFAGIITNLKATQMGQHQTPGDASSVRYLRDAERIAHESLEEARRLVWALRPESLVRSSLSESLHRLANKWSEGSGVQARAVTTGTPRPLLPETEVALLRAAQEALTNVRKHARATRVNITLSYMDERVALDVLDNGVGFGHAPRTGSLEPDATGGFGLAAMRERIEQLGGALVVESTADDGTTLAVELPALTERPEGLGADLEGQRTPERDG